MLSVIIPSRNERYLEQTIRNVLENARGEIEILAVLDGWLPEPEIKIGDDRVVFLHFPEPIGQRQAINCAARQAKGKYIMKLDAHCAVDEGFDVKLAADCPYDWTVIPRMYNLDIETFKPKLHKVTDYMYMRVREDGQFRAEYYTGSDYKQQHAKPDLIDDTMCCMGPCFFMHKERFLELGGCDENHGGWGSQGIEVSCKAWLSGGALKVNKKTWFAHWFRGGSGPGFPYKLSGRQVEHARRYAKDLWVGNKWPQQKRSFQWLIDKFNPPGWEMKRKIHVPRNAKSHVHGQSMGVQNIIDNLDHYWDFRRSERAHGFIEAAIPFFRDVHAGREFTDDELKTHPYYQYLKDGISGGNSRHYIATMRDGIELYRDIKTNGMKRPIEMWVENGKYNISRGTRRLVILNLLGKQQVAVRFYKNREYMEKLRFAPVRGPIGSTAQEQFQRWGWKATDKYWLHDYTPLYDRHCAELIPTASKVLEVGVKRGGSLRLWREVFQCAHIYGVDIDTKAASMCKGIDRITLLEGSQTDEQFNQQQVIPLGPFDLIVDDASHIAAHQIKGFELLWGSVRQGGWYVIEDLYYRNYYREKDTNNMMTKLFDTIHHMNETCEIEAMHFYYNIAFIKKR